MNKLARLLNSASIKRVLLNESLRVDLDRVIANAEVLVVKGALGSMGAGNTSVLMQLLVGMLDAALARQQDHVRAEDRVAVALKVDEAPMVINRGFAETMALKRSAGLETVACWQTDGQWVEREIREQLDGLFAHRVYFATASTQDARAAVALTMAEFSDTVRPETDRLSALGRPDVRLRLPKHHAIASWSTPEGRQAAFVAQTLPMHVDPARLEHHARVQRERGAAHLTDLRQPHWEQERAAEGPPAPAPGAAIETSESKPEEVPTGGVASPPQVDVAGLPQDTGTAAEESTEAMAADEPPPLPTAAAESYRELVVLDGARRMRPVGHSDRIELEPEPLDLEILSLAAELRSLLSSQIHRRFNPGRAATTTQRRLKRLADAGLVERFQFHGADGGGAPMAYAISSAGRIVLNDHGHEIAGAAAERASRSLDRVRHEVHVAGWALALMSLAGRRRAEVWGATASILQPPRSNGSQAGPLTPAGLVLPGGRVAHDFLHRQRSGEIVQAQRFDSLRPDAIVSLPAGKQGLDVLIERDDRLAGGGWAAKLERYDHFLAGWSAHTARYGPGGRAVPLLVLICSDRRRARAAARRADGILLSCRAYAGDYPSSWQYPGRERILFAAERDLHEGMLNAYCVPPLPPQARVGASPQESETLLRQIALPDAPAPGS